MQRLRQRFRMFNRLRKGVFFLLVLSVIAVILLISGLSNVGDLTLRITLVVLALLIIIGAVSSLISARLKTGNWYGSREWWAEWLQGLGTEMFGAILTAILLGLFVGAVQEVQYKAELKSRLLRQLYSPDYILASQAVRDLRQNGWLTDGTLRGRNLSHLDFRETTWTWADLRETSFVRTDLQGAKLDYVDLRYAELTETNLQTANLFWANLYRANLVGANLSEVDLVRANLEGADLRTANLSESDLEWTDFQDANLGGTDLRGANMAGANLRGASLELVGSYEECPSWTSHVGEMCLRVSDVYLHAGVTTTAQFDEQTVLPDGTQWTPGTDMRRFTDPGHPEFQRFDTDWWDGEQGVG